MLLFFSSLILVSAFAFFIANIFDSKNAVNNIIYLLLSAFANVVLTYEVLSLFNAISQYNVLIINLISALIAFAGWIIKKCPVIETDFKCGFQKFFTALKLDKTLIVLTLCFLFASVVSLFLTSFLPAIDIDSTTYHVVRSLFWLDNGSLNHFPTAEARMIMFPVNSEILYLWFFTFLKKDLWLGVFNFCGVILYFASLFGIMSEITKSLRKKLWVILISLSIPFVLVRFTGVETSLIISALVLSSIYLYIQLIKDKKLSTCFMSALALALAVGTKTSVLLTAPALIIWYVWYSWFTCKKNFYRPFLRFSGCFLICFLLFASYNYILNFINYGNILAAQNVAAAHANTDGIVSVAPNLFRYIFNFFAMPEFMWSSEISTYLLHFRDYVLNMFNADIGYGFTSANFNYVKNTLSSADSAFGLYGVLLILPAIIFSVYKSVVSKNRKTALTASFVYIFLLSVVVMSFKLAYMSFNIRFFMTFAMITVPVIGYAYKKKYNFYKLLITGLAVIYFTFISTNVALHPLWHIIKWSKAGASVDDLRNVCECSFFTEPANINKYRIRDVSCYIKKKIRTFDNRNKILYFAPSQESLMPIKSLMFEGYSIDVNLASEIDKININDYNIIIVRNDNQDTSTILNLKPLDNNGYFYMNGILCGYLDENDKIITKESKKLPLKSMCYFNSDFAKTYNLKSVKLYSFKLGEKSVKYNFYENQNRPLIK